jgi:hypothetical protein
MLHLIVLIFISISIYAYYSQKKKEDFILVENIEFIENKLEELREDFKGKKMDELWEEKVRILEKEISLYYHIKGFRNLFKYNKSIIRHSNLDEISALNLWLKRDIEEESMTVIDVVGISDSEVVKFVLILQDDQIIFKIQNKEGGYDDLLVINEGKDSYAVEVFKPGPWVPEIIKCFIQFRKNLVDHVTAVYRNQM